MPETSRPKPKDKVDIAMADTFPASDPPSWAGGITGVRDAAPRPARDEKKG
jgi:hypothetical protein